MSLSQIPFFERGINEKIWREIFKLGHSHSYKPGEVIYLKKQKDVGLICLKKGTIKNCVYLPDGRERTICIFEAPGITGETSVFDSRETLSAAVAVTNVEIVYYSIQEAREIMSSNSDLAFLIMSLMAQKMRSMVFQVESIHLSISKRLARMLLNLKDSGVYTQNETKSLLITHEILASFLGTTRPRVTIYLKNFVEKGFIEKKRGRIIIKDRQGLQEYIDSR